MLQRYIKTGKLTPIQDHIDKMSLQKLDREVVDLINKAKSGEITTKVLSYHLLPVTKDEIYILISALERYSYDFIMLKELNNHPERKELIEPLIEKLKEYIHPTEIRWDQLGNQKFYGADAGSAW